MIRYGWNLCAVLFHHLLTYVTLNPGNCNFDYDLCGWTLGQYPYYSLTQHNDNGINYYLHLSSYDWQTHRLLLESVPLEVTGFQCLTFDFRTTTRNRSYIRFRGDLNVSLVNDRFGHHLVYLQAGNYDNVWQRFFLNVDNVQNYTDIRIRFSASVTPWEDMDLDNIQFLNGSCTLECNFENDLCGITNSTFQKIAYRHFTDQWPDHTSNAVGGHYLYLEGIGKSATFENIHFFLYDFQCITFWYRIYESTSTISVLVEDIGKTTTLRRRIQSGEYIDSWLPFAIDAEVRNRTLVRIRISASATYYGKIGLDDIAITSVSCLDCNFRDGFCNWDTNSTWRITSNGSKYAYPVCNVGKESALISRSEVFQGEKCLSLLHFIEDNVKTYIEVRTQIGWNTVWDNIREKESRVWTTTHININLTTPSRIYISVIQRYGCSKRYFISSISLKQGRCEEPTTISVPATTSKTQYNASYTSIRTTAARKSTSTAFAAADAPTITTTANTTQTTSYNNRTNEFDTENKELQMTKEGSSEVSIGVIIGIVIGCLVLAGAVSLVAVYMYRRRYSNSIPNASTTNTCLYEPHVGVSSEDNYAQIISVSSESEYNMSDRVNYTPEPEYFTIAE